MSVSLDGISCPDLIRDKILTKVENDQLTTSQRVAKCLLLKNAFLALAIVGLAISTMSVFVTNFSACLITGALISCVSLIGAFFYDSRALFEKEDSTLKYGITGIYSKNGYEYEDSLYIAIIQMLIADERLKTIIQQTDSDLSLVIEKYDGALEQRKVNFILEKTLCEYYLNPIKFLEDIFFNLNLDAEFSTEFSQTACVGGEDVCKTTSHNNVIELIVEDEAFDFKDSIDKYFVKHIKPSNKSSETVVRFFYKEPPKDLFFQITTIPQELQMDLPISVFNGGLLQRAKTTSIPYKFKMKAQYVGCSSNIEYKLDSFITLKLDRKSPPIKEHFISYLRKGEKWFECDGHMVKEVDFDSLQKAKQNACLCHFSIS
jgi:hypothetical protein